MINKVSKIEIIDSKSLYDKDVQSIFDFINESYKEIIHLYSDEEGGFVNDIELTDNKRNIFYYIKSTKSEIEGILWAVNDIKNNVYVSKYIGVKSKNKGFGKSLKNTLEQDVRDESNLNKKSLSIVSLVKKENILSQKLNESLGFIQYDLGKEESFFQYYKDIEPSSL